MRPALRRLLAALLWATLALVLLAPLAMAALLAWALPAAAPTVQQTEALAMQDVERALQIARAHDPRRAIPGVVRTLRLTRHEAELLLNHAGARVHPGRWQLATGAGTVQLRASLRLPDNPLGGWVNVEFKAHETRGLPRLDAVRVGRLTLPVPLVEWAVARLAAHYGLGDERAIAALGVQRVQFAEQRLAVTYAWGPDASARVVAALLPAREHERLRTYAAHLAAFNAAQPAGKVYSLSELLPPMFELARQRSTQGGDAALENRAALLVLGMVANGIGLQTLLPERRDELAARPIRLTLAGRSDFPQHLLVSATLAAENGSPMADLIGLYKEMADARGGSGFSFNDMAANRAGVRLGELAVASPLQLQQRLAGGLAESDLLPDVSDLPEFMSEAEFRRRFGGPGAPAYQRMITDIEGRLDATPLFEKR